jgi:tRNA(fMet)-specific endonuclease VapC
MKCADSDRLIDYLNGKHEDPDAFAAGLASGDIISTTISAFEVLCGATTVEHLARIETLLSAITLLPLDLPAARIAAEVERDLRGRGLRIDTGDTLIAGTALSRNLEVITRNARHFGRVTGLAISPG